MACHIRVSKITEVKSISESCSDSWLSRQHSWCVRSIDGFKRLEMETLLWLLLDAGTEDVGHSYNHFVAFFEEFSKIDAMLEDIDNMPPADIQGEIDDPSCSHLKN
jgi:hypothetical protein